MRRLLVGSILALSLVFSVAPASAGLGQPEVDPGITDGTAARELGEARSLWREATVPSYRINVSRYCFCAPPRSVKIKILRGKVVKVSNNKWYGPWTVKGMFKVVSDAIKGDAASLDVKYDQALGYPKSIAIDNIAMAVDDEISYKALVRPLG